MLLPLQIPLALCDVGPTADGTSVGPLKLALQATTLPSALPTARYTQLQSLVLSNNCLKDLKVGVGLGPTDDAGIFTQGTQGAPALGAP
jgi:hypothetical protein